MTLEEMRKFVCDLAHKHSIFIEWRTKSFYYDGTECDGLSFFNDRVIIVSLKNRSFSTLSYWTALHEIGHVVNRGDQEHYLSLPWKNKDSRVTYEIYQEVLAWKFALQISPVKATIHTLRNIWDSMLISMERTTDRKAIWQSLGLDTKYPKHFRQGDTIFADWTQS